MFFIKWRQSDRTMATILLAPCDISFSQLHLCVGIFVASCRRIGCRLGKITEHGASVEI
jgi:hypothetical protein